MKITVPNIITSIRFAAIPFMAYYIYASVNISDDYNLVAFILFISIWTTDLLDGFIARNFNQISDFGKLFDPFVDKLFQFVTALMMAIVGKLPYWVPVVIFIKELLMIVGGAVLLKKFRLVVYSKWYGKLATVLFVLAFCLLFFVPDDLVSKSGYLFILPLAISLFSYVKYGFDNVIPVIYRKSKRYMNSETIKRVIATEDRTLTNRKQTIVLRSENTTSRNIIKNMKKYRRKKTAAIKDKSKRIVQKLKPADHTACNNDKVV
jgi:CDP-diacylglycerol--glycerol-3-phosphate 3-phosphatidyltransferase